MGAIRVHHTATSDAPWDGPANEARLRSGESESYYRRMYAWQDPDKDPTTKSAYKFPHHEVSADGEPGAANIRACQTGIAVLNGARGGADIPESDRRGVWRHLAAHLRDADVEPADLRSRSEMERRAFRATEIRAVADVESGPVIEGYAAVFNSPSDDIGGFVETIAPGAFARAVRGDDDVRALWNHDERYVLGRTKNGTLTLSEDSVGLKVRIIPPDTQWARDAIESIRRGDVDQMSFGFKCLEDAWVVNDGVPVREVREVRLFDVSPVTFPAYPQTTVSVRSRAMEVIAASVSQGDAETDNNAAEDGGATAQARVDILRKYLDIAEAEV